MDDTPTASGSLFRPVKRRKILRKRNEIDSPGDTAAAAAAPASRELRASEDDENAGVAVLAPVQRHRAAKKHGIAFSRTEIRKDEMSEESEDGAPAAAEREQAEELPGSDRFVKPVGKAVVIKDVHMYDSLIDNAYAGHERH